MVVDDFTITAFESVSYPANRIGDFILDQPVTRRVSDTSRMNQEVGDRWETNEPLQNIASGESPTTPPFNSGDSAFTFSFGGSDGNTYILTANRDFSFTSVLFQYANGGLGWQLAGGIGQPLHITMEIFNADNTLKATETLFEGLTAFNAGTITPLDIDILSGEYFTIRTNRTWLFGSGTNRSMRFTFDLNYDKTEPASSYEIELPESVDSEELRYFIRTADIPFSSPRTIEQFSLGDVPYFADHTSTPPERALKDKLVRASEFDGFAIQRAGQNSAAGVGFIGGLPNNHYGLCDTEPSLTGAPSIAILNSDPFAFVRLTEKLRFWQGSGAGSNSPTAFVVIGDLLWVGSGNSENSLHAALYNNGDPAEPDRETRPGPYTLTFHNGGIGAGTPTGLWNDGELLWAYIHGDSHIRAYELPTNDEGSRTAIRVSDRDIDVSSLGNEAVRSMFGDDEYMWVTNRTTTVTAYNKSDGTRAPDQDLTFEIPVNGIWFNDDHLIITPVTGNRGQVYIID